MQTLSSKQLHWYSVLRSIANQNLHSKIFLMKNSYKWLIACIFGALVMAATFAYIYHFLRIEGDMVGGGF